MSQPPLPKKRSFLPRAAGTLCGALALVSAAGAQTHEDFKLLPADAAAGHEFGYATSISDGIIAVGARRDGANGVHSGSVYLFDAFTGTQLVKLVPTDGAAGDEFGYSVAISDGLVAVGALRGGHPGVNSGSAYLFDAATGLQLAKLVPSDASSGDEFGFSIAIDGGVVAVGAKRDDDNGADSGSLYLFDSTSGAQLTKALPTDGAANDNFGESVAMDGGIVVVGAHGDDDNGPLSGSAYLFDVSTGTQLTKLLPTDGGSNDFFGAAVDIDDGVVAVGAWADSIFFDHSGSAYLFDAATGTQLRKIVPSDGHDRDHFGFSVAIDGGVVAIGAEEDDDGAVDAGSAYLFNVSNGAQIQKVLASDGENFDHFGAAIAMEGSVTVIGAHRRDDSGIASGAAYVVDRAVPVASRFCSGDGSGTACPCGNLGSTGRGCANSDRPKGAALVATGTASVGSDDLILRARGSVSSGAGLFFQGGSMVAGGQGIALGDGLRCIGGPHVVRLEIAQANSYGSADTTISIPMAGGVQPGETRYYQWWYRDNSSSPCGSGFNFSNAIEVLWLP